MATNHQLYGPERRLVNIGSYTLKAISPITPAVVSVDLATFKSFLNSQSKYNKAINSGNVVPDTIIVYVAYVDGIYRCRISLNTGGSGTELLWVADADHNTVVSNVQSSTGISLNPTFGGSSQATNVVLNEVTYAYNTRQVIKFYGPVNGVTAQASKVYAPVKDPTLDPYIRAGGAGNIISVDVDKLLFHIPPSRKQKDIAYIKFTAYPTMNGYKLEVYHTDSTSQYLLTAAALLPREIYNILGVQMKAPTVNIAVDYIDFPTGYKNRFKTKIVHQTFGHLDHNASHAGGGN